MFHDNFSFETFVSTGNLTQVSKCLDSSCSASSDSMFAYNLMGLLTNSTDPNGNVSTFAYESVAKTFVSKTENAVGHKVLFEYDLAFGKATKKRGPNSVVLDPELSGSAEEYLYKYDALGRISEVHVPTFHQISYVSKLQTKYEYHNSYAPNFVQKETIKVFDQPETVISRSFFNGSGKVIQRIRSHSKVSGTSHYSAVYSKYDILGQLKETSDSLLVSSLNYSAIPYPAIVMTTFSWDGMGRLIETVDPAGKKKIVEHLPLYKRVKDENGKWKSYRYNIIGKLVKVTNADLKVTHYDYTKWGKLESITDTRGNLVFFTYDFRNRLIGRTSSSAANASVWDYYSFTYDLSDNLTSKTDNRGFTVFYTYDSIHRKLETSYPLGSFSGTAPGSLLPSLKNSVYSYDNPTVLHSFGRLVQVTDDSGDSEFEYNARGNIYSKNTNLCDSPSNCTSYALGFSYNAMGQKAAIDYPYGGTSGNPESIEYRYNEGGRLKEVLRVSDGKKLAAYIYEANGFIHEKSNSYNTKINYLYDSRNRLTDTTGMNTSSGTPFLESKFGYDNVGNLVHFQDLKNAVFISYGYDNLYRLTSMISSESTAGVPSSISFNRLYSYSDSGNLTSKNLDGVVWNYGYNGSLYAGGGYHGAAATTSLQKVGAQTFNYFYDYNGNLKVKEDPSGGTRTYYSFDFEDRLRVVEQRAIFPSITIYERTSFRYNHSGQRVQKIYEQMVAGTLQKQTDIVYVGSLLEHDRMSNEYKIHIFGAGSRIASIEEGIVSLYHKDQRQHTNVVTDDQGNIVDERHYYPYGKEYISSSSSNLKHRFNDKEFDETTGLYFYGARYYDRELSKWISSDKHYLIIDESELHNSQYFNLYSFSLNNPISYVDPDGAHPIVVAAARTVLRKILMGAAQSVALEYVGQVGSNFRVNGFSLSNFTDLNRDLMVRAAIDGALGGFASRIKFVHRMGKISKLKGVKIRTNLLNKRIPMNTKSVKKLEGKWEKIRRKLKRKKLRSRSRDRHSVLEESSSQYEGIQKAQNLLRRGKVKGVIIDSIKKSKQSESTLLKRIKSPKDLK